jgi:hypothetical protein
MTIDATTAFVLMLAAALGGALLGVLPEWRRLMSGRLPIRRHLRRFAGPLPLEAELRCALCAGRRLCGTLPAPLAGCANAALFRKEPSGTTAAPPA